MWRQGTNEQGGYRPHIVDRFPPRIAVRCSGDYLLRGSISAPPPMSRMGFPVIGDGQIRTDHDGVPCCRSLIAVGRLAFFECVCAGFEPGELCHTSGRGRGGLRDFFSRGAPAGQCELCSLQACRGMRANLVDGERRVAFSGVLDHGMVYESGYSSMPVGLSFTVK